MKDKIVYNKLIRDRIPEITQEHGREPVVKILNKKEFIRELRKKIFEEAKELNEGRGVKNLIEELIDIQEIIDTIIKEKKLKFSDFRQRQTQKRKKRGGFKKKLFLIKTVKETE